MAKNIENGVQKLVSTQPTAAEQRYRAWRDLKNKLDSMLMNTRILTSDQTAAECRLMDTMNYEARLKHITEKWGVNYTNRALPILQQLKSMESA